MGWLDIFKRKTAPQTSTSAGQTAAHNTVVADRTVRNLALAQMIYADSPPWLDEESPALTSSGLGPLIAAEVARLITIEAKISVDDDEALNGTLQRYLLNNLRHEVEKGWALGGLIMKPYYRNATLRLNEDGTVVDGGVSGNMKLAFLYPSKFLIHDYDTAGAIIDVSMFSTITQDSQFYTLEERQMFDESARMLTITNKVYRTTMKPTVYKWDNLGADLVPLGSIERWQHIQSKYVFQKMRGVLLGFYKPAMCNNTDLDSPYGMSGLVRAANALRRADLTTNALDWEMDTSLARLFIDAVSLNPTEENRLPRKLSKMVVKLLGSGEKRYFERFAPDIRHTSYLETLNQHLMSVEENVGLAHGTISQAPATARTATEIVMMKQRTMATVMDNQKALECAIRQLVDAMRVWANPTKLQDEEVKMTFDWDDSIVSNPEDQLKSHLALQASGNIAPWRTNMAFFNMNEKDAKRMWMEAQGHIFDDAGQSESPDDALDGLKTSGSPLTAQGRVINRAISAGTE
ncbi:MAG: hypothetical protein FWE08_03785 [Oscillospiraceae bacterium]|nr:hypothetical protein [Oscillospiraceae bacterium]